MKRIKFMLGLLALITLTACGPSNPLDRLTRDLKDAPEYSITLEDMKEEGNFFKNYFHQYKVVYAYNGDGSKDLDYIDNLTDWSEVTKKQYQKYSEYLGMVIASKSKDGKVSDDKYPPGYQYVGDQRYGNWRQDSRGNSFWEFYGKYAMMSHLFGMFNRPVYRNDWNSYSNSRRNGSPFFGSKREYGTKGTYTKQSSKSFFQRQQQKEASRQTSFSKKLKQRTSRSNMSGVRRRSGGFGK